MQFLTRAARIGALTTLATLSAATAALGQGPVLEPDETPQARQGSFTCRASAVRVNQLSLELEPTVANKPGTPCADYSAGQGFVPLTSPLKVAVTAPAAATGAAPDNPAGSLPAEGDFAHAFAYVADLRISGLGVAIGVRGLEGWALLSCGKPTRIGGRAYALETSSTVATLSVNGRTITVPANGAPATIPLLIGTLRLNAVVPTPGGATRRALWLQTLFGEVVAGEARVGTVGDPCASQPAP